ncbi:hypothetical protein [Cellulomonas edaphi]|uniref:MFS transporter n=1 Tax=Cellulomonas edaphi TaxID=3053468 RepID=A0ABT7S5K9_9CELL|nr:hypothetical protein [Cellulomons edaphi]MDM7830905.1 hypothetical protein [Cellulomons edaphi]
MQPENVPPVRGVAAIAMLNLRCVAVLLMVNVLVGAVGAFLGSGTTGIQVAVLFVLIACIPVALVGFPAGLLTAHLLRHVRREWVHVAVFAAVGAALAALMIGVWGHSVALAVIGAVEGTLGAGGARWWSGNAHARAALARPRLPRPEPEDALVDAQLERGPR